MNARRTFTRRWISHDRALTSKRNGPLSYPESVMSLFLVFLLLFLAWRALRMVWRLWSALPSRNADFGLVAGDTGGRP